MWLSPHGPPSQPDCSGWAWGCKGPFQSHLLKHPTALQPPQEGCSHFTFHTALSSQWHQGSTLQLPWVVPRHLGPAAALHHPGWGAQWRDLSSRHLGGLPGNPASALLILREVESMTGSPLCSPLVVHKGLGSCPCPVGCGGDKGGARWVMELEAHCPTAQVRHLLCLRRN